MSSVGYKLAGLTVPGAVQRDGSPDRSKQGPWPPRTALNSTSPLCHASSPSAELSIANPVSTFPSWLLISVKPLRVSTSPSFLNRFLSCFPSHCTLSSFMGHFSIASCIFLFCLSCKCCSFLLEAIEVLWKDSLLRPFHVHLVDPAISIRSVFLKCSSQLDVGCDLCEVECSGIWHCTSALLLLPPWLAVQVGLRMGKMSRSH